MATQATRKLRLAAEEFGKALAWFERGATAEKLNTNAQLDSALKVEKSEKQKIELLKAQINIRVHGYGWARSSRHDQARRTRPWGRWRTWRVG